MAVGLTAFTVVVHSWAPIYWNADDNSSCHWLSVLHEVRTVLSTLNIFCHLILSTALQDRGYHYSPFTAKGTYKLTWLVSVSCWGWIREWTPGHLPLQLVLNTWAFNSVQVRALTSRKWWGHCICLSVSFKAALVSGGSQHCALLPFSVFLLFLPAEWRPQTAEAPGLSLSVLKLGCRDSLTLDTTLSFWNKLSPCCYFILVANQSESTGDHQILWGKNPVSLLKIQGWECDLKYFFRLY